MVTRQQSSIYGREGPEAGGFFPGPHDVFERLLESGIVVVPNPLTDENAGLVVARLLQLAASDRRNDVFLYLNCEARSATATLAVLDVMEALPADVVTVCLGQAGKGAAVLLAAGTKHKRWILPNARVVLGHGSEEFSGATGDLEVRAREVLRQRASLDRILARLSGKPEDDVSADAARELVLTAPEARAYGIVDRIVERRSLPRLDLFVPGEFPEPG